MLEGYPNRNSLPYVAMYGIGEPGACSGTLRNKGWCRIMGKIMELGYLGEDEWLDLGARRSPDSLRICCRWWNPASRTGCLRTAPRRQAAPALIYGHWSGGS